MEFIQFELLFSYCEGFSISLQGFFYSNSHPHKLFAIMCDGPYQYIFLNSTFKLRAKQEPNILPCDTSKSSLYRYLFFFFNYALNYWTRFYCSISVLGSCVTIKV